MSTESSDILTDGRWVNVKGVQRWAPNPTPDTIKQARKDRALRRPCPFCGVGPGDACRTPGGHFTHLHATRQSVPRCPCGEPINIATKSHPRYCEPCAIESRRASWRAYRARAYGSRIIQRVAVVEIGREAS